ncbi:MAG: hypothetical protein AAF267_19915 [Deinococcota bacterium]
MKLGLSLFVAVVTFASAQDSPSLPDFTQLYPYEARQATVLHEFEAGTLVESIAVSQAGSIYATVIHPQDISKSFVWYQHQDDSRGQLHLTGAGTLAFSGDGHLYVNAGAAFEALTPDQQRQMGIYRLHVEDGLANGNFEHGDFEHGGFEHIAVAPQGAALNGITFDADNNLYAADSLGGKVWILKQGSNELEVWLEHDLLAPAGPAGFPGANGLKFFEGSLYVSNSSTGNFVRIDLTADGQPDDITIHSSGVNTDDFAFDVDGNIYATTHPFNTVVQITQDNDKVVLAASSENVIGPTAAVFGVADASDQLFVVTDGGLYEQMIGLRHYDALTPALVQLDIGIEGLTR